MVNKDCKCNEIIRKLTEERDILWERKGDEKKLRDVLLQIRVEYKKAFEEIVDLQRVVISQAKEIEQLKQGGKDE